MIQFDTSATANRTSYLTLEESSQLMLLSEDSDDFMNLDDESKKVLLMKASMIVDSLHRYIDKQYHTDQVLQFPRGTSENIPVQIKMATSMIAIDAYNNELFSSVTSETIGKLSWDYDQSSNGVNKEILSLLNPFVSNTVPFKVSHGN